MGELKICIDLPFFLYSFLMSNKETCFVRYVAMSVQLLWMTSRPIPGDMSQCVACPASPPATATDIWRTALNYFHQQCVAAPPPQATLDARKQLGLSEVSQAGALARTQPSSTGKQGPDGRRARAGAGILLPKRVYGEGFEAFYWHT